MNICFIVILTELMFCICNQWRSTMAEMNPADAIKFVKEQREGGYMFPDIDHHMWQAGVDIETRRIAVNTVQNQEDLKSRE